MAPPLLELSHIRREYRSGDGWFAALKDINLTIEAGELVAIVGASGSGKSTLMNILGCLDEPTSGTYRVAGHDTAQLDADALAALRRERLGFIFQRYNLMPDLTAVGNVEIPAIYAGKDRGQRQARASALLSRLGLGHRLMHRPSQLSGGQQQRVSIARALMNGGEIILADEPTGALDSHVGEEVLAILKELHAEGHTILMVTHDMHVAQHADRIIEMIDGEVIMDRCVRDSGPLPKPDDGAMRPSGAPLFSVGDRMVDALHMALVSMWGHRLRTFLTMLGIIIGIAAVASVVALGEGGRRRVLADISDIGTNTIEIYPGASWGDEKAKSVHTLISGDAAAIAQQDYVDSVTPMVTSEASLRFNNVSVAGSIQGVGRSYFRVHGIDIMDGRSFSATDIQNLAQVAVIDHLTRERLFPGNQDPIGQVVFLGNVPCHVIGVANAKADAMDPNRTLRVWVPYTTSMGRMLGQTYLESITARIANNVNTDMAAAALHKLLAARHGRTDFFLSNNNAIRKSIEGASATLSLLIASIALISLIVGGIGVMNITLVSVAERTREIGLRIAVGARQRDILSQFLIEAILVCLLGGALGVSLALGLGFLSSLLSDRFPMVFSTVSIVAAVGVSTLVGLTFGFLPARNAARLNPVDALARE